MEIFRDTTQPGNFRIMAGREVLDRAYGKAAQPYRHGDNVGNYDLSKLTDDQLRTTYEILKLATPDPCDRGRRLMVSNV